MKQAILLLFLAASAMICNAQKVTYDSLSRQKVVISPTVLDYDLCETIYITKDDVFVWSGISRIKTCKEFLKFKRDYPNFQIPALTRNKFKCK